MVLAEPFLGLPQAATLSSPILDHLRDIHARYAGLREGDVATYIPGLANANPEWFGICLVTCGGHVYEVGDTAEPFSIQSISKPFAYAWPWKTTPGLTCLKKSAPSRPEMLSTRSAWNQTPGAQGTR